jgi:AcrR family transcriptional regulator
MTGQQRWGNNARQNDREGGRDRILASARRCYARQGIAGTTLEDIAAEAHITRRTLYRYFANKQAIIQAVVDAQALDFLRQMQSRAGDDSLSFADQLQRYIVYLVRNGQQAPGYQLLLGKKNIGASAQHYLSSRETYKLLSSLLRASFREAQQLGTIRADLDFDDLLAWTGRVVFSYIQAPATDEQLERQVAQFVIPAILPGRDAC